MVRIKKQSNGDVPSVSISGTADEETQLSRDIPELPRLMLVNCRLIDRINSSRVRTWIRYFKELTGSGFEVRYQECPPAIVEQINNVSNFVSGGQVESISLPYSCGNCRTQLARLTPVEPLADISQLVPEMPCPKCDGKAVFDEIEAEHFAFLHRKNQDKRSAT